MAVENEKRGAGVGKTKRGKGTKIMAVADGTGLPVAVCAESATPHEVTFVQQTLAEIFVAEPIERLTPCSQEHGHAVMTTNLAPLR